MRRFRCSDPGFEAAFAAFADERRETPEEVDATVRDVLAAVKAEGLPAVLRLARKFDRVELDESTIRVSEQEIEAGVAACPGPVSEAIEFAARRIRAYHERQRPADQRFTDETGVELGWRWTPLDAVGIYVPGGRAAYPSTVLMNAVPAAVAGVGRIAMVTPPGRLQPAVLAAAKAAGVVGIDALAGPSEIVVVADSENRPEWIAADLLSQAEHDPAAQAVLITDDEAFAATVEAAVQDQLSSLATGAVAAASWRDHGAVVIAPLDQAPRLVDRIAPEHVEFAVSEPEQLAARVRHAGAIFLGRHAPEAIGDYVAGSNHVLPTSRAARFSSGLSLYDFLKRTSIVKCDAAAFAALAPATVALAEAEGLPAHARSAAIRMGQS